MDNPHRIKGSSIVIPDDRAGQPIVDNYVGFSWYLPLDKESLRLHGNIYLSNWLTE